MAPWLAPFANLKSSGLPTTACSKTARNVSSLPRFPAHLLPDLPRVGFGIFGRLKVAKDAGPGLPPGANGLGKLEEHEEIPPAVARLYGLVMIPGKSGSVYLFHDFAPSRVERLFAYSYIEAEAAFGLCDNPVPFASP